jgi:hypothetical protein
VGIGEEVSTLPDGTPQHDPAPNPLARVVPRGRGYARLRRYQSMSISTYLCRGKSCIRQCFGPTLEPCPARIVQFGIVPQDGIAIDRQSQRMASENGLSNPLLAPTALLLVFLGKHPFPYVVCGLQTSGDKRRRPGTELSDRCQLKGVRAYGGTTQRLASHYAQQNRFDDSISIPLWIATDRSGIDSSGNKGVAPGTEGQTCCTAQPAIVPMHGRVP